MKNINVRMEQAFANYLLEYMAAVTLSEGMESFGKRTRVFLALENCISLPVTESIIFIRSNTQIDSCIDACITPIS